MRIKKASVAIILLLICLNLFQLLWYINPLAFLSEPRVPDEETAIAIARDFEERLRGVNNDEMVFVGEYIEGNGRWFVQMSPPIGHFGRSYIFAIRARDGRVIDFSVAH